MRIATNLSALSAFTSLNSTNKSLQKTINALSSGLRINSASDDAAGFAISEKMRSQISGLDVALQNSQDGISLLQTAEGALEQMNSMLSRMRELAIQASNDSLTSNDRQYIQLEIDELKKQIDRIADTTQFNKKKLLDGSSGALWASSDLNAKAKIYGGLTYIDEFGQKVSAEGNYRIDVKAEAGERQVQKSNIYSLKEIKSETEIVTVPITEIQTQEVYEPHVIDLASMTDNSEIPVSTDGSTWEFTTDSNGNNYLRIYGNGKFNITGTPAGSMYINVDSTATDATIFLSDVNIDNSSSQLSAFFIEPGASVDMYLSGNNTLIGGGEYAGLGVPDGAELTISSISGDGSENGTLTATGGEEGGAGIGGPYIGVTDKAGTITINGGTIIATAGEAAAGIGGSYVVVGDGSGGNITINGGNVTAYGGSYVDYAPELLSDGRISFYTGAGAGIGSSRIDADLFTNDTTITITGGTVNAYGGTSSASYNGSIIAEMGAAGIGGGIYTDSGTIRINAGVLCSAQAGRTNFSLPAGYDPPSSVGEAEDIGHGWNSDYSNVYLNASIETLSARDIPELPKVFTGYEDVEVIVGYDTEEVTTEATRYKKLSEIPQFYNASGVLTVEPHNTITITQGNGKSASVTLYPDDTIEDAANKINDAIANSLGQARYTDNPSKFCTIADGTEGTSESVQFVKTIYDDEGNITGYDTASTMLVRSAIPGKEGELYFSGDEELLNALGFNTIRESSETQYTSSVYNAHSGKVIAHGIKSTGNILSDVIPNVDIEFDPMAGIKSTWDENTKRYVLSEDETYSAFIHLKDNSTTFQTGANQGEDFMIQLGDMSSKALEISGVSVVTRETASSSVSIIDRAINHVSSQRAKIGAYQNALEHTMTNLTTTSTNLTSAESRIRDADMSQLMIEFVRLQILNQSGTSMLAQANQLPQSVLRLLS